LDLDQTGKDHRERLRDCGNASVPRTLSMKQPG
jgi:hypothetical protein